MASRKFEVNRCSTPNRPPPANVPRETYDVTLSVLGLVFEMVVVVIAVPSHSRIMEEGSTNHSPPGLFFFSSNNEDHLARTNCLFKAF